MAAGGRSLREVSPGRKGLIYNFQLVEASGWAEFDLLSFRISLKTGLAEEEMGG